MTPEDFKPHIGKMGVFEIVGTYGRKTIMTGEILSVSLYEVKIHEHYPWEGYKTEIFISGIKFFDTYPL